MRVIISNDLQLCHTHLGYVQHWSSISASYQALLGSFVTKACHVYLKLIRNSGIVIRIAHVTFPPYTYTVSLLEYKVETITIY